MQSNLFSLNKIFSVLDFIVWLKHVTAPGFAEILKNFKNSLKHRLFKALRLCNLNQMLTTQKTSWKRFQQLWCVKLYKVLENQRS